MNNCLCIISDICLSSLNKIPPSACNNTCGDNSDDIYLGECGGKRVYNIYKVQGGYLHHGHIYFPIYTYNEEVKTYSIYCNYKQFIYFRHVR